VLADDRRALKEWGYVALSRARELSRLYTIEDQFEPHAPPHRVEPAGPVDRLAEALARPAAETLALDATRGGRPLSERVRIADANRRLLERKAAVEKERRHALHELRLVERRLGELGAFGRACHSRALRQQIEEREREVRRLDRDLTRIDEQGRLSRERLRELAHSEPRRQRSLGRKPGVGRDLGRERSLDRGIEL